jgi:UDP-glucose 4-epimerase
MMIQSFFWKQPEIETAMLRPVHMIGENLQNAPSRYLKLRTIPTLLGFDPMVQLVAASDVVRAIRLSLKPSMRGIFNVVGPSVAPLTRILDHLGAEQLRIPEFVLKGALKMMFYARLSSFPAGEVDHLKYACLVDGARAEKVLGYKAQVPLKEALDAIKAYRSSFGVPDLQKQLKRLEVGVQGRL